MVIKEVAVQDVVPQPITGEEFAREFGFDPHTASEQLDQADSAINTIEAQNASYDGIQSTRHSTGEAKQLHADEEALYQFALERLESAQAEVYATLEKTMRAFPQEALRQAHDALSDSRRTLTASIEELNALARSLLATVANIQEQWRDAPSDVQAYAENIFSKRQEELGHPEQHLGRVLGSISLTETLNARVSMVAHMWPHTQAMRPGANAAAEEAKDTTTVEEPDAGAKPLATQFPGTQFSLPPAWPLTAAFTGKEEPAPFTTPPNTQVKAVFRPAKDASTTSTVAHIVGKQLGTLTTPDQSEGAISEQTSPQLPTVAARIASVLLDNMQEGILAVDLANTLYPNIDKTNATNRASTQLTSKPNRKRLVKLLEQRGYTLKTEQITITGSEGTGKRKVNRYRAVPLDTPPATES